MNNVLLLIGALLVGILAALLAVPMVVDWNSYRGVFEEEASRVMGRDVRLSGPINVRILPVPYVQFDRLRIADPSSTGGDQFFRAENLTMRLSVGPLLRGVVEAQHLALKSPSLRLAVDGDGGGNWRSLSIKPGTLPFLPADVSLPSVEIKGGQVQLVSATGQEIAQLDAIDGEFSAEGLEGPYKFKGNTTWYGAAREVRFSTAKPEPDGSVRVKTSLRIPSNQNTYVIDGRILDWTGRARIEGDLTAKLPLATPAASTDKTAAGADSAAFELKSRLTADLTGGKLTEVALALDSVGDPQLITGDAVFAWGQKPRFDMALASRSLNLDRFSPPAAVGQTSAVDPLVTAHAVLNVVLAALPAQADTEAKLKAERVTLAGDTLTGLSLAMSRRGGVLEVRDLRALLPGQTRLEVSGTVSRETQSFGFEGPIALRGAHLARFLAWARKDGAVKDGQPKPATPVTARYDGPFALEGRIATTPTTFELTRVVGEFADTPISGEIKISREARQKIVLLLEGPKLDLAEIWPGGLDMVRLRALLLGTKPSGGETKAQPTSPQPIGSVAAGLYGFNPDTTDIKVELRTSALQTTRTTLLRDVDAAFSIERGKATIKRVRFTTSGNLAVDVEGYTNAPSGGAASTSPSVAPALTPILPVAGQHRGSYRWVVDAPNAAALDEALTALDWPANARPPVSVLASLGNVRLAGSAIQGERAASALDIVADGTVDGGRFNVAAKIDAGNSGWRTAPIDVLVDLETSNLDRWIALVATPSEPSPQRAIKSRSGKILIKTKGEPQSGVTVLALATGDGLSVNYHGSGNLDANANVVLVGNADVAATEANDLLALAQLPLGQGATGLGFEGRIDIDTRDGHVKLATDLAKLGASTVRGNLAWTNPASAKAAQPASPRTLTGALAIDKATLAGLVCSICDRRNANSSGPLKTSAWPDSPLVWSDLSAWSGKVALAIGTVSVDGSLGLKNTTANLTIGPEGVAVDDIIGTTYGGRMSGQFKLARSTAGTDLTGTLAVQDGDLKTLNAGATAPFALSAKVASQGLSPSGLVAALQGRADVTLGPARLTGLSPAAVVGTIDAAYEGKLPVEGEALVAALRTGLANSTLQLDSRTITVTIKDGVARTASFTQATSEGRVAGEATLDLNQLKTSSDWRIEPAARPPVAGAAQLAALPAVLLSTTGTMTKPDADTKLVTSAFEQELVVRKMERDVQELERLRLLDEERQRVEAERDRLEAERVKAEEDRIKAETERIKAQQGWAPVPGDAQATQQAPPPTSAPGVDPQSAASVSPAQPNPATIGNPPATAAPTPRPSGLTRAPASNPPSTKRRAQEGVPPPFQNY